MKTYKVTINHDIYHTYIVLADSPEEAEEKANEGEYERIDDITCDSSYVEYVEETEEKAAEDIIDMPKDDIYRQAMAAIDNVLLNCEVSAKLKGELELVSNYLENEFINA